MFRLCWTQQSNDCAGQASSEIKIWLWHNALAMDPKAISYIYPFDPFNLLWLAL